MKFMMDSVSECLYEVYDGQCEWVSVWSLWWTVWVSVCMKFLMDSVSECLIEVYNGEL